MGRLSHARPDRWRGCAHADQDRPRLDPPLSRDGRSLRSLAAQQAYLDGELCAVSDKGLTSFSAMQAATDLAAASGLVYFLFDLLYHDGEDLSGFPLRGRKGRLKTLMKGAPGSLQFS